MTQKEFAQKLVNNLFCYNLKYKVESDTYANGTRVLYIRFATNVSRYVMDRVHEQCDIMIKGEGRYVQVDVRPCKSIKYPWCIQILYTGDLPEIDPYAKKKQSKKTEQPKRSGSIVTPFGIGYYTDEEDKKKLEQFINGLSTIMKVFGM